MSRSPSRRLGVEWLETRLAPAVNLLWIGLAAGDHLWSTAANWADMADKTTTHAPAAGDSLIFDQTKVTAGAAKTGTQTTSTDDIANGSFKDLTVAAGFGKAITIKQTSLVVTGIADVSNVTFFSTTTGISLFTLDSIQQTPSTFSNVVFDSTCLTVGVDNNSFSKATIQGNLTFQGDSACFTDWGGVKWISGDISLAQTSIVSIMSSGVFDAQGAGKITGDNSAGACNPQINVDGWFLKSGGATTVISNSSFKLDDAKAKFMVQATGVQFTSTTMIQSSGLTELNGGGLTTDGSLVIQGGRLDGIGTIDGILKNQGGIVHPGLDDSGGRLYVTKWYEQSAAGTLAIDVTATAGATAFGILAVQSYVSLAGKLAVTRLQSYQPPLNTNLKFLTWGNWPDGSVTVPGNFATKTFTNNNKWNVQPDGSYFIFKPVQDVPNYEYDLVVATIIEVCGRLWNDTNHNGIKDGVEAIFANVVVTLTNSTGATFTATTDTNGNYEIADLALGTYTVSTAIPSGTTREGYYKDDGTPIPTASATLTSANPVATIDAAFIASSSSSATTTSLSSSSPTTTVGNPVSLTAMVTAISGTPTGAVTFYDGNVSLGTVSLPQGMNAATLMVSTFAVGAHSLSAVYNGDTAHAMSTSSVLTETVQKATDMSWLMASSSSVQFGHPVTFTDTISDATPLNPTGTVSFYDNGVLLAVVNLNQMEQALLTLSNLSVGSHTITATYSGDANFNSSSATFNETVYQ